jgi:hypothetical protein
LIVNAVNGILRDIPMGLRCPKKKSLQEYFQILQTKTMGRLETTHSASVCVDIYSDLSYDLIWRRANRYECTL